MSGEVQPYNPDVASYCASLLPDEYFVDLSGVIYDKNMVPLSMDCADLFERMVNEGISNSNEQNVPDSNTYTPSVPNTENWAGKCTLVQQYLLSSCTALVNPDVSLTVEGERAKNCITNGAIISGVGVIGLETPIPVIVGLLEPASKLTGCDVIVKWQALGSTANPTELLKALGLR